MGAGETRLRSAGPQDTEAVGARLAGELSPGAVVLLTGDLGAGKTTLVRGAVRALGHPGRVTSPTFTLVNRYDGGRVPVSHIDLYRLGEAGLDGEDPALLEDELAGDRIVFVEWPQAAVAQLPPVTVRVALRHAGGDAREIEIARGDAPRDRDAPAPGPPGAHPPRPGRASEVRDG